MRPTHDELIDALAREMTDVDPSPDFSRRVLADLTRRASRSAWWFGLAAAGAAVIAALALPPSTLRKQQIAGAVPPIAPVSPPEPIATTALAGPSERPDRPRVSRLTAAKPTADELAWLSRAVPALGLARPIAVDGIQPERPAIAPITVESLTTAPISLPPIDTRSGGRH